MNRDLTKGSVLKSMLLFSIPMILGDLLQQCYNIVDTLIVGQFLGKSSSKCWLIVYLNDIYNIYNPWFMYGKWSVVFN